MKRFILGALFLLTLATTACGTSTPPATTTPPPPATTADESPAVREAFETYKKAALGKDGNTAVGALASPIFAYYEEVAKLALTASEQQTAGLPVSHRITVHVLRAEMDAATLRTSSPQDLVKIAIDKGLVGEQGISNLELGEVTVTGDTATGEVIARGQKAPFKFAFTRERAKWRIDIKPMLDLADDAFTEAAKQQGMTVDQLVDQLMVTKYGAAKAAEIRKPLES